MIHLGTDLPTAEGRSAAWRSVGQLVAFAVTVATFLQAVVSAWIALGVAIALMAAGVAVLAVGALRPRPQGPPRPFIGQRSASLDARYGARQSRQ